MTPIFLAHQLNETDTTMCFACREPLTVADQKSPHFIFEKSCPYCVTKGKVRRFHAAGNATSTAATAAIPEPLVPNAVATGAATEGLVEGPELKKSRLAAVPP